MEQLCTQSHIGYSGCENNTILCRYPGTRSRAASEPPPPPPPPYTEENSFATLAYNYFAQLHLYREQVP